MLVGGLTPEAVDILMHGKANFGVPRDDLLIGYVPVEPDCRGVLTDAPLLINNAERYRRAGVNLATLVLESFRDVVPGVVDRLRQVPYPRIHALLAAIGDAPMQPDAAGDMRITLPGGGAPVRLDEIPPPAAGPDSPRTWWGLRRREGSG